MLSPLPGLEHQAVHRVEIGQKVSHALLEINKQLDKSPLPQTDQFPFQTEVKRTKDWEGKKQYCHISVTNSTLPDLSVLFWTPILSPELPSWGHHCLSDLFTAFPSWRGGYNRKYDMLALEFEIANK